MTPLRLLTLALRIAIAALAIGSIVAVATLPSTLGSGSVGVTARVASGDITDAAAELIPQRLESATAVATIDLPNDERDARAVVAGTTVAGLALAWVGLLAVHGVVVAAAAGEPFGRGNVNRLRRLGGSLVGVAVLAALANRLLEAALDAGAARPQLATVDTLPVALFAIAAFALAEVFRTGTELRDLDAATI